MRFYRVKQIGENKFIPQTATLLDFIYVTWVGIERRGNNCTWFTEFLQEEYCICETLEEAREVIKIYKKHIKPQKVKYNRP